MSGKLVAVVQHRASGWRYKLMLRVDGRSEPMAYWRHWSPALSRERLDKDLVELKLKDHIAEVVWPEEDRDEPGSSGAE